MRVTRLTKLLSWVAMASVVTLVGQANGQTIHFADDFEAYAGNQAAFEAAWTPIGSTTADGTNPTGTNFAVSQGPTRNPPNADPLVTPPLGSTTMIGTTSLQSRNQKQFPATVAPSLTTIVRFSFDFYDVAGADAPFRHHNNLQDTDLAAGAGTNQLVSMGLNNNQTVANSGGNFYMARIVGFTPTTVDPDGGPNESVVGSGSYFKLNDFGTSVLRSTGWHNLRVDISDFDGNGVTDYRFYVDGAYSEQVMNVGSAASVRTYDTIRIGSGLTSLSYLSYTDNVKVEIVPVAPPVEDDADFDGDGDVDGADFLTWQRNVEIDDGTANLADGDANDDGNVDGDDLDIWKLQHPTATAAVQAIPEPASLALAGLALVAGVAASRRRR